MNNNYNYNYSVPGEYRPISAWGYFGYSLLFYIPVVGFILAIVFSFNKSNINLRNFARSQFCVLIVAVIITVIAALLGILPVG